MILLVLIGWPVLEIATFIQVGAWIGLVPTILLFLAAGAVGLWMLRAEGVSLLLRAQTQMRDGIVPMNDGTLREDWANRRPCPSIMLTARSQLSRTTEENEVRTKVCAVSSINALKRRQTTPI